MSVEIDKDKIAKLGNELVSAWGERTRSVLKPLSALLGEALREQNVLAAGFILQCADGVLSEACSMAREVQARRGAGPTDVLQ